MSILIDYGAYGTIYLNEDKQTVTKKQDTCSSWLAQHLLNSSRKTLNELFVGKWFSGTLQHQNILPLLDAELSPYCIEMKFPYATLRNWAIIIQLSKNITSIDLLLTLLTRFTLDIGNALDTLHAFGFGHFDVRPCNLFATTDKYIHSILGDFGLAFQIKTYIQNPPLNTLIKNYYIPPYLEATSTHYDETVDYWALGVSSLSCMAKLFSLTSHTWSFNSHACFLLIHRWQTARRNHDIPKQRSLCVQFIDLFEAKRSRRYNCQTRFKLIHPTWSNKNIKEWTALFQLLDAAVYNLDRGYCPHKNVTQNSPTLTTPTTPTTPTLRTLSFGEQALTQTHFADQNISDLTNILTFVKVWFERIECKKESAPDYEIECLHAAQTNFSNSRFLNMFIASISLVLGPQGIIVFKPWIDKHVFSVDTFNTWIKDVLNLILSIH